MFPLTQRATEVATLLLDRLLEVIREQSWNDPCITTVMPGSAVPFDYCNQCEEGMAWVRIVEILPLTSSDQAGGRPCVDGYDATVEVGMIRGAHLPQELPDGIVLPDAVDQYDDAMRQYEEMGVMLCALNSIPLEVASGPVTVSAYTPIGPEGGCVGGTWLATVGLT